MTLIKAVCRDMKKMLSHHLSIRRERMLHLRSAHIQARFSEKQEFCSEKSVFINVTHTHTLTYAEQSACRHRNTSKKALLRNTCSGRFTFRCSCVWCGLLCERESCISMQLYAWPHTTDLHKTHQRNSRPCSGSATVHHYYHQLPCILLYGFEVLTPLHLCDSCTNYLIF